MRRVVHIPALIPAFILMALVVLVLPACTPPAEDPSAGGGASAASEKLHALFEGDWEFRVRSNPLFATSVGRHEWDDELPSAAPEAHDRWAEHARQMLEELAALDLTELDATDRTSAEIFERQMREGLAGHGFRSYEIPINADSGFHIGLARLPRQVPLRTVVDYESYIARLNALPRYFSEQIANMRAGLERGMSLPRVVLEGYDVTIRSHVVDDPEASLFYAPFEKFPVGVPESGHERLREAGRKAVEDGVVPAYRSFLTFMLEEYLPNTRTSLGASELPDGEAYYAHQVRRYTTLDLTAEEIHQKGLEEVARIRGEMQTILDELDFDGDLDAFFTFLRTDPRFYAKTPEELLREAAWIAKSMDAELPALFGRLPRQPYGVAPVPDHMAPKYTGGRYVPAPEDGTRPGYYWVNTYDLKSRPLYILEALTLHEAVPGHHLQIALSQELESLPPFRRFDYISAFGEGWGLYSEWLGLEAGFYTDPYSNFGRLTYEMWRACRLVVDTGLHAFGWTRDEAMDYLASNTALSLHEVRTETDRYISWPGQALAYKIGELEIKVLRRQAEDTLGADFDVREFHDVVLGQGSVPLEVLRRIVGEWIAAQREAL